MDTYFIEVNEKYVAYEAPRNDNVTSRVKLNPEQFDAFHTMMECGDMNRSYNTVRMWRVTPQGEKLVPRNEELKTRVLEIDSEHRVRNDFLGTIRKYVPREEIKRYLMVIDGPQSYYVHTSDTLEFLESLEDAHRWFNETYPLSLRILHVYDSGVEKDVEELLGGTLSSPSELSFR